MSKLRISPDLALPLEAITETIAILGIRGSGKTNTAAVYAEELLKAGQQVVIVDPTDGWWGLKSSADGLTPGFPVVVLGGKHQDLPLASGDGKLVADFVVEEHASVICSLRGFESKQQELRFGTDFFRRLYYLKGQQDAPAPLALFIDEASRLVPQRVMGEDAQCVGAVQQIVRQGRSSGFGCVLIDQRAATVNKDVLAQLEMMIVHRTTGPQDRKALKEWIEAHDTEGREKEFLGSLASLAQGEAWFWSPGWLDLFKKVQVRARKTFDSSRTPRAGEVVVTPKQIADVDLEALRAKLAATIEKAKADDPKELRKEIAELKRALAANVGVSGKEIERLLSQEFARGLGDGEIRGRHAAMVDLKRAVAQSARSMTGAVRGLGVVTDEVSRAWKALQNQLEPSDSEIEAAARSRMPERRPVAASRPQTTAAQRPPRPVAAGSIIDGVTGVEQRILNTLKALEEMGVAPVDKPTAAALVGYHPNAKSYANALGSLRTAGRVEYPNGQLALTDAGRAIATSQLSITSVDELHRIWFERLGNVAQRILEPLIKSYPHATEADAVAISAGYHPNAKSFSNMKGRLRTLGLIDYPGPGKVVATKVLFPEGLY